MGLFGKRIELGSTGLEMSIWQWQWQLPWENMGRIFPLFFVLCPCSRRYIFSLYWLQRYFCFLGYYLFIIQVHGNGEDKGS